MRRLGVDELAIFCQELQEVLKAGLSIEEGIHLMKGEVKVDDYARALDQLEQSLKEGQSIGTSLRQQQIFPEYMVQMMELGFELGQLEQTLDKLSHYYKRQDTIQTKIKEAALYPIILLGIMSSVMLVITTQIFPIFKNMMLQIGLEMSSIAMQIIEVLTGIVIIVLIIVVLLFVLGGGIWFLGNKQKDKIIFSIIKHTSFYEKLMLSHFLNAFAMMMSNGMASSYAVKQASKLINHKELDNKLDRLYHRLENNECNISDIATELGCFSGVENRMLAVSIKTGLLDEAFEKLAMQYEQKIVAEFERKTAMLEPTLTIILATMVTGILLAVMLPLLNIISSIG